MSSCVITKIAAAVRESFCSFFETEVTLMFIRSSIFIVARSTLEPVPCSDFCPKTGAQKQGDVSEEITRLDLFSHSPARIYSVRLP